MVKLSLASKSLLQLGAGRPPGFHNSSINPWLQPVGELGQENISTVLTVSSAARHLRRPCKANSTGRRAARACIRCGPLRPFWIWSWSGQEIRRGADRLERTIMDDWM